MDMFCSFIGLLIVFFINNQTVGTSITTNLNGIYLYNSTENVISVNNISNNSVNGILISAGSDNEVSSNKVTSSASAGISIQNSNNNKVCSNILPNNLDGIYLNNSSTEVHFNQIVGNSRYGLYNQSNGTINATNNWWGSNNPNTSLNSPSDISINGGIVKCGQWLVLNLTSSADRSNRTGTTYNHIITADLTHNNQGKDTSNGNSNVPVNLPDGIPINFTTTFGTINTPVSTRNGKSVAILNSSAAGSANVTVTFDNQSLMIPVNITSVDTLGVYNNRTGEGFSSIQSAINSNNTLDGDTITLADGTYTENVVVYKKLTIKSVPGANAIVQAADSSNSVFTIVESGSTIQNLNIMGAADSNGIMGYANNVNLIGNIISANKNGITLFNSNSATISGNTITNNLYGIYLYNSTITTISGNTITENWYGMYLYNSTSIGISENNVTSNWYGITLFYSNSITVYGNNITDNYCGMSLSDSDSTTIFGNTITNNGGGISYYKSNNTAISGNTITDNEIADISQIDTAGVVMQNNIWNCGPASLATVLNNLGVNVTQNELAGLAGTDKDGTTMYGLIHAAQVKGLNATGMILSVDQLKPGYMVLLTVGGLYHFSVIKSINSTTVYLADSMFGNINMTLEKFIETYSGYALIITSNSTNSTVNGTVLTNEQMQGIKGTYGEAVGVALGYIINVSYGALLTYGAVFMGTVLIFVPAAYGPTQKDIDNYKNRMNKFRGSGAGVHGRNPTRKPPRYTKPTSPGNKYIPGRGYVSPKGYTPSTVSLIDLEYQRNYEKYLDKKANEWNKIYNCISEKDKELEYIVKGGLQKEINKIAHGNYSGDISNAGDPDDPFLKKLRKVFENCTKRTKRGITKVRSGDIKGGLWDIAVGTFGLWTVGPSLAIYESIPKK